MAHTASNGLLTAVKPKHIIDSMHWSCQPYLACIIRQMLGQIAWQYQLLYITLKSPMCSSRIQIQLDG